MPSAGGFERLQQMKSLTKSVVVRLSLRALPLSLSAVEVDGVVATVGTESILRSDVIGEMRRAGADDSQFVEVRNRLIERKLIIKAAREQKMTMQDWVVENRIREIIDSAFGGDMNKLKAVLAAQKVQMSEWRERIKDDMVVGAMRWNIVEKNVTASPAEMKAEYKKNPARYLSEPKTTVGVILLKPEDSGKRAEVTEALQKDAFEEVAKRFSADTHASEGGLWKDVNPATTFRPEVANAIAAIKTGETSDWVNIEGWSFLLKKIEERAARQSTFAEAYAEIEANVKRENAAKMYADWINRLKAENYIKVY